MPRSWWVWYGAGSLYLVAFLAMSWSSGRAPYGDEAAHFMASRTLWSRPSSVLEFFEGWSTDYSLLFWQRPGFALLLAPAAVFGFEAFRLAAVAASALMAPLAYLLLVRMGRPLWIAGIVGASLAVNPVSMVWGARVFPDALLTVCVLAALLLMVRRQHLAAAVALAAAALVKETAMVACAALVLARLVRPGGRRTWPWLEGPDWYYLGALVFAPVPLLVSLLLGQRFPGWTQGGDAYTTGFALIGSVWILAALAFGAISRPRHPVVLTAAAYIAFYLGYHVTSGILVQGWYLIAPLALAAVVSGMALDDAIGRVRKRWPTSRRVAGVAGSVLLVFVLMVPAVTPAESWPSVASQPMTPAPRAAFWEVAPMAAGETRELESLVALLDELAPARLVMVDVGWYYLDYPLSARVDHARFAYSGYVLGAGHPTQPLFEEVRQNGTVTVIGLWEPGNELHADLVSEFESCALVRMEHYLLVEASRCSHA